MTIYQEEKAGTGTGSKVVRSYAFANGQPTVNGTAGHRDKPAVHLTSHRIVILSKSRQETTFLLALVVMNQTLTMVSLQSYATPWRSP